LVSTQGLAHDVEAARERGVAEGAVLLAWEWRADGRAHRLLGIREFGLRLGERCCDRPDRFTGPLHGPNSRLSSRSLPHLTSSAWRGRRARRPPWLPRASAP